ncbi:MAG: M48 family metallopeptidase [Gammaproteobacteria bacterium]|nr:M48 family metallopeptidase [Gammaproteobacteria bacterium]
MSDDALQVRSEPITWELRRSARRRTIAVEVHRDLRVIVRAPATARMDVIREQVTSRRAWIERTLERFRREGLARRSPPAYLAGSVHPYLGEACRLDVVRATRTAVSHAGGVICVALRGEPTEARVRSAVTGWYRERALALAQELVAARFAPFAARGHRPPSVTIRRMTSRWGSLVARRRMTLALTLVQAPRDCFEYVVVHELCHLEHSGHGADFRDLMDRLMPDWRDRRRLLERTR